MHRGDKPDSVQLSLIPSCGPFGLWLKKLSVAAWTNPRMHPHAPSCTPVSSAQPGMHMHAPSRTPIS